MNETRRCAIWRSSMDEAVKSRSRRSRSAGKDVVFYTVTGMAGFTIASYRDTGEKLLRIKPFALQLLVGNVDIFCWNREEMQALLYRLNAFPTKGCRTMMWTRWARPSST